MKTVFLLRHAKSSWNNPGLADHERPLNGRGNKSAKAMGEYAAHEGLKPGIVFSSTSQRTRETIAGFAKGLDETLDIEFMDELYLASPDTILQAIQTTPADVNSVMIVAHNPGTHYAALELIKSADANDREALEYNFPTAALAEYQFEADQWTGVRFGQGTLIRFILPRQL